MGERIWLNVSRMLCTFYIKSGFLDFCNLHE